MSILFNTVWFFSNCVSDFSEHHRGSQAWANRNSKVELLFFYDVSKLAKSELGVLNHLSMNQIDLMSAIYLKTLMMVIDISLLIKGNISKSQIAGQWKWNLAFINNLSRTRNLRKQFWDFIKNIKDITPKYFLFMNNFLCSGYLDQ